MVKSVTLAAPAPIARGREQPAVAGAAAPTAAQTQLPVDGVETGRGAVPVALETPAARYEPIGSTFELAGAPSFPSGLNLEVQDAKAGSIAFRAGVEPSAIRRRLDEQKITLLAVRHGQSESNALTAKYGEPVLAGRTDAPLTAHGEKQAATAGASLYEELGGRDWLLAAASDPSKLPVLIASPLQRTQQTARGFTRLVEAEAKALAERGQISAEQALDISRRLQPEIEPRIIEMNYGDLELRPLSEMGARLPELRAGWDSFTGKGTDFLHAFPAGESRLDVLHRESAFLSEVADRFPHRTVVCFTHLESIVGLQVASANASTLPDGTVRVIGLRIPNASVMHLTGPSAPGMQDAE